MKKYTHFVSYDDLSVYVTVTHYDCMEKSALNLKIAQIMGNPIEACHQFATYRMPKTIIERAGIVCEEWFKVIFLLSSTDENFVVFERQSFDEDEKFNCMAIANQLRDLPFSDDPVIVNCIERLGRGVIINNSVIYNLYIENGCSLLHTVKAVKNLGGLGLKEAKELVDLHLCN